MGLEGHDLPPLPGNYLSAENEEALRRIKEQNDQMVEAQRIMEEAKKRKEEEQRRIVEQDKIETERLAATKIIKPSKLVEPNIEGFSPTTNRQAEVHYQKGGISVRPFKGNMPSVEEPIVFPAAGPEESGPVGGQLGSEVVTPVVSIEENNGGIPSAIPIEAALSLGAAAINEFESQEKAPDPAREGAAQSEISEKTDVTKGSTLDPVPPDAEKVTKKKKGKGKKIKVQGVDTSDATVTTPEPPQPIQAQGSVPEKRTEKTEHKSFDGSPEFNFLSQLYMQGMEPEEMEQRLRVGGSQGAAKKLDLLAERFTDVAAVRASLTPKDWDAAVASFCKLVKEGRNDPDGFDPAARMMANITRTREGLTYEQLNAENRVAAAEKFTKATQELWKDFYYSGRWKHDDKRGYYVSEETDLDAKVSLFLAKKAGILDVLNTKPDQKYNAKPLAASEHVPGATTLDSGWVQGVKLEEHPDGTSTLRIDNHPEGRTLVETSTAKILYRLLSAGEMINKSDNALKGLVELSVADDNAHLITNKQEFSQSDRTLRGLHKYFNDLKPNRNRKKIVTGEERLYTFIQNNWRELSAKAGVDFSDPSISSTDKEKAWWKVYGAILDKQLNPGEIKKYSLDYGKRKQRENIDIAWEMLAGKTDTVEGKESLVRQGRLVKTSDGQYYLVDIVDMNEKYKGFKGGHEAIQAFGLDGRIAFDKKENSFLVNTMRRTTDLSKTWKLPQGVPVRGAMVIKPKNGVPLKFGLKEILDVMAPGYTNDSKGIIKDYLENGPPPPKEPERDEAIEKKVEALRGNVQIVWEKRKLEPKYVEYLATLNTAEQSQWHSKAVAATLDLYKEQLYAEKNKTKPNR